MAKKGSKRPSKTHTSKTPSRSTRRPSGKSSRSTPHFWSIAVVVSDRARSVAWYTENLGLEVVQDLGHWVTVGHRGENGTIHLCQGGEIGAELEPGVSGINFHLRVKPSEFAAACAELAAKGVAFHRPAKHETWGWWASIVDPDGNVHMMTPDE
jgi:catechol 2,3-dioxygenase-like lactoylglutathione lyase family enzyme